MKDIVVTENLQCPHCKMGKSLEDFQTNKARYNGRNSWCKVCEKVQQKQWAKDNPQKVRDRLERWKNLYPEAEKEKQRRYRQNHSDLIAQRTMDQRRNFPDRIKARKALAYAVKTRKVLKPNRCEHCQKEVAVQGHHEDYAQPLIVQWLCARCHKLHHLENIPWTSA